MNIQMGLTLHVATHRCEQNIIPTPNHPIVLSKSRIRIAAELNSLPGSGVSIYGPLDKWFYGSSSLLGLATSIAFAHFMCLIGLTTKPDQVPRYQKPVCYPVKMEGDS